MNRKNLVLAALAAAAVCISSTLTWAGATPDAFRTANKPWATSVHMESNPGELGTSDPKPGEEINKLGDLNHDGLINYDDLAIVIAAWGEYDWPTPVDIAPPGGDYRVGYDDLLVVLMNWGM